MRIEAINLETKEDKKEDIMVGNPKRESIISLFQEYVDMFV